ncbi:hypothetical protein GGR47_002996, partial [Sphingomonas aquatilis]|nr:hypothetical protein [Sphingomonas aquatilis]MBB3876737.1 hypothetical protein [Sphingomonas aquatilis]
FVRLGPLPIHSNRTTEPLDMRGNVRGARLT